MQFATPSKITLSHWLFFLGYVPFLKLRLVLKRLSMMGAHEGRTKKPPPPESKVPAMQLQQRVPNKKDFEEYFGYKGVSTDTRE